jgi:hypothetical protein
MTGIDTAFVGLNPEFCTRYMGPMLFEPYAADMARRLEGMTSRPLSEPACRTGIVTRALAAALTRTVAITATDLDKPMLDFAQLQPGGEPVAWQQADAQDLPFPDQASAESGSCPFPTSKGSISMHCGC